MYIYYDISSKPYNDANTFYIPIFLYVKTLLKKVFIY